MRYISLGPELEEAVKPCMLRERRSPGQLTAGGKLIHTEATCERALALRSTAWVGY